MMRLYLEVFLLQFHLLLQHLPELHPPRRRPRLSYHPCQPTSFHRLFRTTAHTSTATNSSGSSVKDSSDPLYTPWRLLLIAVKTPLLRRFLTTPTTFRTIATVRPVSFEAPRRPVVAAILIVVAAVMWIQKPKTVSALPTNISPGTVVNSNSRSAITGGRWREYRSVMTYYRLAIQRSVRQGGRSWRSSMDGSNARGSGSNGRLVNRRSPFLSLPCSTPIVHFSIKLFQKKDHIINSRQEHKKLKVVK